MYPDLKEYFKETVLKLVLKLVFVLNLLPF